MTEAPPRRRRWFAVALLIVLLLVFAEVASWFALWSLLGVPPALADLRAERARRAGSELAAVGDDGEENDDAGGLAAQLRRGGYEVLQPYLGFVWTPEADLSKDRYLHALEVDRLGFLVDPRDPAPPPGRRPVRIGIFGGSVANILFLAGRRPLTRVLMEDPEIAARGIEIQCFAIAGYKQPQQLMTLAWLLTLGEAPDLVVNVDGFNEVALPAVENRPQGTHPLYPRRWAQRLGGLPDLPAQLTAGELAYARQRRRDLAASFSKPVLGRSATWNLLWLSRDRRLAAEEAAAEVRLASVGSTLGYAAHGPSYQGGEGDAVYADLVAAWARASRQMRDLAAGAGLPYHHFLQPNQYDPGSKPLSGEERALFVTETQPYRPAVEAGYPLLRQAGGELRAAGVDFHDESDLFATVTATVYGDDCCHYNAYGNRLLGEAVARAIRDDVARLARQRP